MSISSEQRDTSTIYDRLSRPGLGLKEVLLTDHIFLLRCLALLCGKTLHIPGSPHADLLLQNLHVIIFETIRHTEHTYRRYIARLF